MGECKLTDTEEKILERIRYYANKNEKLNISTLAKELFVSGAAIIKLSKKMGYSGYSEMFYSISTESSRNIISVDFNDFKGLTTKSNDVDIKIIAEILYSYKNSNCLLASLGYCDAAKDYLMQKLWSFNFKAFDSYHREATKMHKGEKGVFFIFSESGNFESIIRRCEEALKNNYNIIAFTSNRNSKLASIAHLTVEIESNKNKEEEHYIANLFTAKIIVFIELLFQEYSILENKLNV